MKTYATCSCCACCSTTSYAITTVPSLLYSLTCGSDQNYATVANINLNAPGFNAMTKGALTPPLGCSVPCNYRQANPGGGVSCGCFHPRCSGTGVSWSYTAYAGVSTYRNSSGTFTHVLVLSHQWGTSTSGPTGRPPFTVGCTWSLTKADKCPNGTYATLGSTWTDCGGSSHTEGTYYTLDGQSGKPTISWGSPSTVPVVA